MNDAIDLRMVLGLVRRQIWMILSVTLAVTFAVAVIVFSLTPRYSAQALVLVDTTSKNLLNPENAVTNGSTDNSRVEGEVRIVQSDAVLLDVIKDGGLISDPEFGLTSSIADAVLTALNIRHASHPVGDAASGRVLKSFRNALRVRREGLTYLITVEVTSEDPGKAAQLANLVTAAYIENQVGAKVSGMVAARNILQARVSAANTVLIENENKLGDFISANGDRLQAVAQPSTFVAQSGSGLDQARIGFATGNLPPEMMAQFYNLQQSAQIARAQYQNLLTRLQDLEAQASLQIADSRVVSPALAPIEPSYPKKGLILALTILAALGLGTGVAFFREFFIGGFTSEDQVNAVLSIPLASVAPYQAGSELGKPHGHGLSDNIISSPLSVFSESIRRIRVSIEQILFRNAGVIEDEREGGIVVMVSSAVAGEGKSTLATSLARTYALAGKRTLLIDCDLRKPSIHRHIDREPMPAFVNLLRGESDAGLANLVIMDNATNLSVIVGASRADFPTDDLLMNPKIGKLLVRARQHFDFIVIDTSPVGAVVDGLYLARLSDVVLFVVRWATTPQNLARKAIAALKENVGENTPIVAVLNRQEQTRWLKAAQHSSHSL